MAGVTPEGLRSRARESHPRTGDARVDVHDVEAGSRDRQSAGWRHDDVGVGVEGLASEPEERAGDAAPVAAEGGRDRVGVKFVAAAEALSDPEEGRIDPVLDAVLMKAAEKARRASIEEAVQTSERREVSVRSWVSKRNSQRRTMEATLERTTGWTRSRSRTARRSGAARSRGATTSRTSRAARWRCTTGRRMSDRATLSLSSRRTARWWRRTSRSAGHDASVSADGAPARCVGGVPA